MDGKIYKLCVGDHFYIGSTKESMPDRIGKHKATGLKHPEMRLYKCIAEHGGWGNVIVEVIEEVSGENLRLKENEHVRKHLDDDLCLNKNRPVRTREELREWHRRYHIARKASAK